MADEPGSRGKRPLRKNWDDWSDLPIEVRSAVVWSFWAGGPADAMDWERFEAALTVGTPLHDAAFLEETRWMVRGLEALNQAGAFTTKLAKERIFEAVALWMGKTVGSVKRDAGGYGMRGKPKSSRWAVEAAQDWMKEHRKLNFIADSVPDFAPVLHLLEPSWHDSSFLSWSRFFGDGHGRQIKPKWSNRVLRKHLFQAKDGVHWGYVTRDLPTQSEPGVLVFQFPRLDPTPLSVTTDLDFGYWLNRRTNLPGTSAFPLNEPPRKV